MQLLMETTEELARNYNLAIYGEFALSVTNMVALNVKGDMYHYAVVICNQKKMK